MPQTPGTPSTAAAHYFDDILIRSQKDGPRQLRRSSTSRNLGGAGDDETQDARVRLQRANSVGQFDEDTLKEKSEQNGHVAAYVTNRLERLRTSDTTAGDYGDEIETQLDGARDYFHPRPVNGRRPSVSSESDASPCS